MTTNEFRNTPKQFYCTYGHLNCSIIDEGPCSDELETRLEQRANPKKLWKIQVKAVQGWADLKVNVDGTDKYVDDFCESEAEAQGPESVSCGGKRHMGKLISIMVSRISGDSIIYWSKWTYASSPSEMTSRSVNARCSTKTHTAR
jgi:hypothetical protein